MFFVGGGGGGIPDGDCLPKLSTNFAIFLTCCHNCYLVCFLVCLTFVQECWNVWTPNDFGGGGVKKNVLEHVPYPLTPLPLPQPI